MMDNFFFYLGLALFAIHEMDAIRCKEWRIFPLLSMLKDDRIGYIIFVFAHIPIFFFIYWKLGSGQDITTFIHNFDIFMIIHLFLHILFLKHKNNEFKDWVSWIIIVGTGLCGLIDFIF